MSSVCSTPPPDSWCRIGDTSARAVFPHTAARAVVGVCARIDCVSTCCDEQPELIFDGGACRDNAYFLGGYTSTGGFAIQGIDHCGEAGCLPGYGCLSR